MANNCLRWVSSMGSLLVYMLLVQTPNKALKIVRVKTSRTWTGQTPAGHLTGRYIYINNERL